MGIFPAYVLMTSRLIPASFGVQGPGEMTRCEGASAAISAAGISSLRTTRTSCPISPRYWTRL